ncbi:hypothetical protein NIES2119_25605 [[Phormidium ambiguum] IAM M-71]|uniref:Bacteriocin n=1 Tax=[Phormidium ambiguum] IAM M-71 TaxID=454136 RepID=A0A1U7I8D3_9CYAN|nr:hypothetical protein [Phormidium ambiguum]OKH32661.1 hypothetical protein NIES2119_25605 [Phormidium ambiguum IAM M-71]
MENNPYFQEQSVPTSQMSKTEIENAMDQELNESELEAIAGGKFDFETYLKFQGIDLNSTPIKLIPLN